MIKFELRGIEELERAIDRAERRFDKALRIAVGKAAAIIEKAAENNIDDDTGELRKHVKRKIWKKKPGVIGYVIGPSFPGTTPQQRSYYGPWLEEGHRKAAPGKRLRKLKREEYELLQREMGSSMVPPHPWLRPAFDQNKDRAYAEMARIFRQAVDGRITESDVEAVLEELAFGE